MIARISGVLLSKQPAQVVIDVQGVAYEIEISFNSFCQLPAEGDSVMLHTHFVVREDAQLLFGFSELDERSLFRILIKVNGVGPKLGLAILSGMDAQGFCQCVQNQDAAMLELGDKLSAWQTVGSAGVQTGTAKASLFAVSAQSEAESALVGLGYKPVQASKAVLAAVKSAPDGSCEDLIRLSLKGMI